MLPVSLLIDLNEFQPQIKSVGSARSGHIVFLFVFLKFVRVYPTLFFTSKTHTLLN